MVPKIGSKLCNILEFKMYCGGVVGDFESWLEKVSSNCKSWSNRRVPTTL